MRLKGPPSDSGAALLTSHVCIPTHLVSNAPQNIPDAVKWPLQSLGKRAFMHTQAGLATASMVSNVYLELQLGVVDQLEQVGPKGRGDVSGCVAAQLRERAAVQLSNDLQICHTISICTAYSYQSCRSSNTLHDSAPDHDSRHSKTDQKSANDSVLPCSQTMEALNGRFTWRVNPPVPAPTSATLKPVWPWFSHTMSSMCEMLREWKPCIRGSWAYSTLCSECCTMAWIGFCTTANPCQHVVALSIH